MAHNFRTKTTGKENNQDQNRQKTPTSIGNPADVNKPQVNVTVGGRLGKGTSPNSQTNNRVPSTSMRADMSPNAQKQDAFPTKFPTGNTGGKHLGVSGLDTKHINGRDVNLTVTSKLPTKTAPNNQNQQLSGTKI